LSGRRHRRRDEEGIQKARKKETKQRKDKKQRRGSSVGRTALPHCHLRLQLQAAGSRSQGDSLFFKNRGKEKTRKKKTIYREEEKNRGKERTSMKKQKGRP
jgi:hypothetical protein